MKGKLLVLNKSDHTGNWYDLVTGRLKGEIATGNGPHEAAVSPNGSYVVVTDYGSEEPGSSLTVYDVHTQETTKIDLRGDYHRPHGIVFISNNEFLVTVEAEKMVLRIDVTTGDITGKMNTDQEISHMVAYHPEKNLVFTTNIGSGSVSVINLENFNLLKVIKTGEGAEGLDLSPDGEELWVTNRASDKISIINTNTLTVVEEIESKGFPIRVKFTPNGGYAVVSNARAGTVSFFDAGSRILVREISMEANPDELKDGGIFGKDFAGNTAPVGILIHPDGNHAFIANTNADVITVIDINELKVVSRMKTGREPDGMALLPK